jgi:uncharacterized protein (UPF0305 family)
LTPSEKLRQAILDHVAVVVNYLNEVNVYLSDMRFLSKKNRNKYIKIAKSYEANFIKIIDEIKKEEGKSFKGMDSKAVAFGILGMCNWIVKWYKKDGRLAPEEIAETFYAMIAQKNVYTKKSG